MACEGGVKPLKGSLLKSYLKLIKGWKVVKEHQIEKEFKFKDFKAAWKFTDNVAKLAENEGHHPDIHLSWGKVKIVTWTHAIDGLSENDFILATKIDLI